ncbi:GNAT family N-acetyltransferase [Dyadobacter sp. CY312]|uniref:GNAT family N-acetyltransferase n=1 Tax=Dyadobacter sp. CY312 TaxID=2907303 RepID=UPI001F271C7E|nr:GNAT family N-acetyltransferase [Dyadobacter sp. CY312]MCE7040194.1 GNAT family N-acetyltransferase [Dyadobacter sp. CY312]
MPNQGLIIREAMSGDEGIVYRMICELENQELNRTSFQRIFEVNLSSDHVACFIAELEDIAVGMVTCHIQPLLHHAALVAEIQEMFVYPEFRSQQIGHALMNHAVEFAKSKGAIQLEVTSRATRESAHKFYQREGFEKSHVKLVRYFGDKQ